MIIIAVDDEISALNMLKRSIAEVVKNAEIACFESAKKALEYAKEKTIDIAFIDIEMPVMNGLILAKKIKDIYSEANIIFVTGYNQYAEDALKLRVSGYVLKPIDPEHVKDEIENLRNPIELYNQKYSKKRVYIQCFGNFEIYVDGNPIRFARSKSKEFIAYLVNKKGAAVSKKELAAVILEKDSYTLGIQAYVQNIISEASRALEEAGAANILIKQYGYYHIDISKFSCDYYDYNNCNINAVNSYHGEYMANYPWAEFIIDSFD